MRHYILASMIALFTANAFAQASQDFKVEQQLRDAQKQVDSTKSNKNKEVEFSANLNRDKGVLSFAVDGIKICTVKTDEIIKAFNKKQDIRFGCSDNYSIVASYRTNLLSVAYSHYEISQKGDKAVLATDDISGLLFNTQDAPIVTKQP